MLLSFTKPDLAFITRLSKPDLNDERQFGPQVRTDVRGQVAGAHPRLLVQEPEDHAGRS